MANNRLQPENLTDFTGGLNYSTDQFSLADNESPDMMNIDLDPRSGFSTRQGWRRWNDAEIAPVLPWKPRNATVHTAAAGDQTVFVVNAQKIYAAPESGVFTELVGPQAMANPQGADFTSWGEQAYIACGMDSPSYRYEVDGSLTLMTPDVWSEVDTPTPNTMPTCGLCEGHAGYLFAARLAEAGYHYNTRIRWSHPNRPDSWREEDYLDIDAYGGKITAILSFRDHLLIFKTTSLWALYGYGDDSWQLSLVSSSIGCPSITATTKSENSVFFFSASNKNGVYAYSGGEPTYISEKLRPALSQIGAFPNVFVSWANRKLWVAVPWRPDAEPPESTFPPPPAPPLDAGQTGELPMPTAATPEPASLFIFDQDVGQGVWTIYRSPYGSVASVVDGSDINSKFPLAAFWSESTATMLVLDSIDDAYDEIFMVDGARVRSGFAAYYRTRWLHGGWPDRKKSWRRPTFICRRVPRQVDLLVEHYRDYDETTTRRTGLVPGVAGEGNTWTAGGSADPNGIDWGGGDTWGAQVQGAVITRSDPMGHARAMQMRVLPASYTQLRKWGVDGIIVKTTVQRFRT